MSNNKDIKYINRDFSSFKQALIDFAKTYFPNTYTDFSDENPGNMYIEMASYVGDVLSFYLDKQIQENFLEYASQKENLISLAYTLGYRPKVTSTSLVDLDVFQILPAKISGSIATPDYSYCLSINKEAKINSVSNPNVTFITQDSVNFSFSSSMDPTTVSVYQINSVTNQPDYYLLKKTVKAYAGTIKSENFTFSSPKKFDTVTLSDTNIIQILDVIDSDGYKWYEVPYLAQNTIFEDIPNNSLSDPTLSQYSDRVPYLLRLRKVQRRFTSRFTPDNTLKIEFGAGVTTTPDEEIIPNSDNVGMGLIDSISKMNLAFDPSNFLYTKEYGISPSNTTLTFRYVVGGGVECNVPSNDITSIYEMITSPVSLNVNALNTNLLDYVKRSVSFNNPNPASGGGDGDSVEDIRLKTMASFPTQLRNVTPEDHMVRALSMPGKFGTVAKAYLIKDDIIDTDITQGNFIDNNPLSLSLYILSFDSNRKLTQASYALKQNLKNYLSQYNIANDAVNIKDAYVINIGVNIDITVLSGFNSREVLSDVLVAIKDYFTIDKWGINAPIILSELYTLVNSIKGVQSLKDIKIVNKSGEINGYSKWGYDITGATRDGVVFPSLDPSIFEVKYPDIDIFGRVVTL